MSKDCPLSQGGAVPAAVAELVLTLIDAQLGAFADDDDGVGATLAEGSLTRSQAWDLVADDVRPQGHHGGQCPEGREGGNTRDVCKKASARWCCRSDAATSAHRFIRCIDIDLDLKDLPSRSITTLMHIVLVCVFTTEPHHMIMSIKSKPDPNVG